MESNAKRHVCRADSWKQRRWSPAQKVTRDPGPRLGGGAAGESGGGASSLARQLSRSWLQPRGRRGRFEALGKRTLAPRACGRPGWRTCRGSRCGSHRSLRGRTARRSFSSPPITPGWSPHSHAPARLRFDAVRVKQEQAGGATAEATKDSLWEELLELAASSLLVVEPVGAAGRREAAFRSFHRALLLER